MAHPRFGSRVALLAFAPLLFGGVLVEACGSTVATVTCGPGTELEGSTCVAVSGSSSASSGSGSSVASGSSSSSGAGGDTTTSSSSSGPSSASSSSGSSSASTTAGSSSSSSGTGGACATQCDCLSGTICAVGGVCEVPTGGFGACDQTCQTSADCTCGTCNGGVCTNASSPKYAGSGDACQFDCDCPQSSGWGEQCVGGRCIRPCDSIGPSCVDDSQCSACNESCLGNGGCAKTGSCFNGSDCLPFPGELCSGSTCAPPPGTRYATSTSLPAGQDALGQIVLDVPVPAGVTVTDVVVVLDVMIPTPDLGTGSITLQSPDGTMVTLGSSFMGTSWSKNGVSRTSYATMGAFKGTAATGSWIFTLSDANNYQVDDLALYIQ